MKEAHPREATPRMDTVIDMDQVYYICFPPDAQPLAAAAGTAPADPSSKADGSHLAPGDADGDDDDVKFEGSTTNRKEREEVGVLFDGSVLVPCS